MARPTRIVLPGYPLHVIQRGNNRQPCFFTDDDCIFYLERLEDAASRHGCYIHAYVLMTNHVHLLLTPETEQGVSRTLQSVGRSYVRSINAKYGRSGTLWEGRYKSALVESDRYFLACSRYIELNPVRAGMVESPAGYRWSSYGQNGLGQSDALLSPHSAYQELGSADHERRSAYRNMFQANFSMHEIDEIREATTRSAVLGNERFRQEIEAMVGRRVDRFKHGGDRKSRLFREGQ